MDRPYLSGNIQLLLPDFDRCEYSEKDDKNWLVNTTRRNYEAIGQTKTLIDLFCGCGGLSLGVFEALAKKGFSPQTVFACEIDSFARRVYMDNLSPLEVSAESVETCFSSFGNTLSPFEKQLQKSASDLQFLVGGPPCQGHSDLNNHSRRSDKRNDLYYFMARAAEVTMPEFIIIENVPGVLHSKNKVVERTHDSLKSLGYRLQSVVLNSKDYGVAQSRKRHFTVGAQKDIENFSKRLNDKKVSTRGSLWAFDDLLDLCNKDSGDSVFNSSAQHSQTNQNRINYLFENDIFELPDSMRPDCHRLKPHSYKSVYGRMYPDLPSPTITSGFGSTGQGRFVHPLEARTVTPHEAARLQFFPDWFHFGNLGRRKLQMLIGNAVPARLAEVIATTLLEV